MEKDNCAYKQLNYYPKCKDCPGTKDIDICYISHKDLREHLIEFDKLRLTKELGALL